MLPRIRTDVCAQVSVCVCVGVRAWRGLLVAFQRWCENKTRSKADRLEKMGWQSKSERKIGYATINNNRIIIFIVWNWIYYFILFIRLHSTSPPLFRWARRMTSESLNRTIYHFVRCNLKSIEWNNEEKKKMKYISNETASDAHRSPVEINVRRDPQQQPCVPHRQRRWSHPQLKLKPRRKKAKSNWTRIIDDVRHTRKRQKELSQLAKKWRWRQQRQRKHHERKFLSLNDSSDSAVFDLLQIFFSAYFILLFIRLAARIL